jgi:hypothetical protein
MFGQHDQRGSGPAARALQQNHSRAVARGVALNHCRNLTAAGRVRSGQ